jgi:hypothetical protein
MMSLLNSLFVKTAKFNMFDILNVFEEHKVENAIQCISESSYKNLGRIPYLKKAVFIPDVSQLVKNYLNKRGWKVYEFTDLPKDFDALLITDKKNFRDLMRKLEPLFRKNFLILPFDTEWVVPSTLKNATAMHCAWNTSDFANYVARCNLKGHYLEFGTFWGRSFFENYFILRHWLNGSFYAFDSFNGLSVPEPDETRYTGGDFLEGAYCSNEKSFLALGDLLGVEKERMKVIPGFYSSTLNGVNPVNYDLLPNSVSVCYIDCDLRQPTEEVLKFVSPLLESGALLYFDDWRLCRASNAVGERAAALRWLELNPQFELIEFSRSSWQNQWFIFQKICR